MSNHDILFRNFSVFSESENGIKNLKSLIFQSALNGKLDFQKLSEGRIKMPLQALIKEQKRHLKKEGIVFEEEPNNTWPIVKIGNVCKIVGGGTPSTSNPQYWNGSVHWITPKDLSGYSDVYISKGQKNITKEGLQKSSAKIVPQNTVLLSTRAPIGYVAIAKVPLATNQGFRNLVPYKKCFSEYIYYILKSKTKLLNILGSGATFKELSGTKLKNIKIPLPLFEVQKEIASLMKKCVFLESQLKEKSTKHSELSESSMYFITQSKNRKEMTYHWEILKNNFKDILCSESGVRQFKSMIFQLCLNGKLNFQKLSEGRIKRPLQALVKEQREYLKKEDISFEDNLDNVWPVVELGKITQVTSGQSPKSKYYNKKEKGLPFYQGKKDFTEVYLGAPSQWTTSITKTAMPNDILMSVRAPVGPVNVTLQKICIGRGLASIRAIKINHMFLFYFLKENQDKITGGAGSVFNSINQESVKKIKISLPSSEVQREIVSFIEKISVIDKQIYEEKCFRVYLLKSLSSPETHQNKKSKKLSTSFNHFKT